MKIVIFIIKSLAAIISLFLILFMTAIGYVYLNQDKIKNIIIENLNTYINTPVKVQNIEIDCFQKFPNISLKFEEITMNGSPTNDKSTLLAANKILLTFSILDILNQKYSIKKIYLDNAHITIITDINGKINYNVIKQSDSLNTKKEQSNNLFELKSVHLSNVNVEYINKRSQQEYDILINDADGGFKLDNEIMATHVVGDMLLNHIKIDQTQYIKDKSINLKTTFSIDNRRSELVLGETTLKIKETEFKAIGKLQFGPQKYINIDVSSTDSKVSTILSLLPEKLHRDYSKYQSSGEAKFHTKIIGEFNSNTSPDITVTFGLRDISLKDPNNKVSIKNFNLNGTYSNKENGILNIEGFHGLVDNSQLEGNFLYQNFKNPYLKTHFNTNIDLKNCLELATIKDYESALGKVNINFNVEGKIADIKAKDVLKTHISGDFSASIEELKLKSSKTLKDTHIKLRMDHHDLIVDTLFGKYNNSDFNIKGKFKNFILFILDKESKINLDASLVSNYININDLYSPRQTTATDNQSGIKLPQNLILKFKCNVETMTFNNLKFKKFKGGLSIIPHKIEMHEVATELAGGHIKLSGNAISTANLTPRIDANIDLNNIYIDTVLNLFNDFDQKFITSKNIKGQLSTKIYINFGLNSNGQINTESIFSNIDLKISNGELVNFRPMEKLSRFIDEKELYNIHFSELKNSFHIENSVITVPEMIIKSNLNTVAVMGVHKFSTEMDYKLKIDLKRKKKDSDEKFGSIRDDNKGTTQIFITMKGTPENMKIAYDKDAVKEKIKTKWGEEKKEMQQLFKKDPPKVDPIIEIKTDENDLIDLDN